MKIKKMPNYLKVVNEKIGFVPNVLKLFQTSLNSLKDLQTLQ